MERLTVKQLDGSYHIYDTSVIQRTTCCDENNRNAFDVYEGTAVDKLGYYEEAEEQGLLLRLPCKVGDTVYTVNSYMDCCEEECPWVEECCDECVSYERHYSIKETRFQIQMLAVLEKTVFLTKEEAEKALERMG